MPKYTPLRFFVFICILFSILFAPIWLSVILALAGMAYFPFFIEVTFLYFLSDLLYGVAEAKFHGILFSSFIIAIIAFTLVEFLKKELKFYP